LQSIMLLRPAPLYTTVGLIEGADL
jgi:hypothetical protein